MQYNYFIYTIVNQTCRTKNDWQNLVHYLHSGFFLSKK